VTGCFTVVRARVHSRTQTLHPNTLCLCGYLCLSLPWRSEYRIYRARSDLGKHHEVNTFASGSRSKRHFRLIVAMYSASTLGQLRINGQSGYDSRFACGLGFFYFCPLLQIPHCCRLALAESHGAAQAAATIACLETGDARRVYLFIAWSYEDAILISEAQQ